VGFFSVKSDKFLGMMIMIFLLVWQPIGWISYKQKIQSTSNVVTRYIVSTSLYHLRDSGDTQLIAVLLLLLC